MLADLNSGEEQRGILRYDLPADAETGGKAQAGRMMLTLQLFKLKMKAAPERSVIGALLGKIL